MSNNKGHQGEAASPASQDSATPLPNPAPAPHNSFVPAEADGSQDSGWLDQESPAYLGVTPGGSSSSADTQTETCPSCGTAIPSPRVARPSADDGYDVRYEKEDDLGFGGMGVVELVKNVGLGRREARKFLLAWDGSPEAAEAFRQEMEKQANLSHPGIVPIYHADVAAKGPFFTMEYMRGKSLRELIEKSHRDERWPHEAARILMLVAEAVQYMHDQGTCHRDLKPKNILLTEDHKTPKVADFGLARFVAPETLQAADVCGTPVYMPPEAAKLLLQRAEGEGGAQRQGAAAKTLVDDYYRRGDVYGLGAVLYEALTGEPPFPCKEGQSRAEILRKVAEGKIVSPRQRNRRVPKWLDAVCRKCLANDPQKRYASAANVARDLHQFVQPASLSVRVTSGLAGLSLFIAAMFGGLFLAQHVQRKDELQIAISRGRGEVEKEIARAETAEKPSDAVAHLERARASLGDLLRLDAANAPELHLQLAGVLCNLGKNRALTREYPLARQALNQARRFLEEASGGRRDRLLADVLHWEGVISLTANDYEDALRRFRESGEIWDRLAKGEETQGDEARYLARSYGFRGDAQLEMGQIAEAKEAYEASHEQRTKVYNDVKGRLPEDVFQYQRGVWNFATHSEWLGRFAEAIEYHKQRQAIFDKHSGERVPTDFREDLADCPLAIAELMMLLPSRAGTKGLSDEESKTILDLLQKAENYQDAEPSYPARVCLARGKCKVMSERKTPPEEVRHDVLAAINGYHRLVLDGKVSPADLYRVAQGHALMWRLTEDRERAIFHKQSALEFLMGAANKNYRFVKKVESDPAFEGLRSHPGFKKAIEKMSKR